MYYYYFVVVGKCLKKMFKIIIIIIIRLLLLLLGKCVVYMCVCVCIGALIKNLTQRMFSTD